MFLTSLKLYICVLIIGIVQGIGYLMEGNNHIIWGIQKINWEVHWITRKKITGFYLFYCSLQYIFHYKGCCNLKKNRLLYLIVLTYILPNICLENKCYSVIFLLLRFSYVVECGCTIIFSLKFPNLVWFSIDKNHEIE